MTEIRAILLVAGTMFGIWPLFMNYNGVKNASIASVVMEVVVLLTLLPFGLASWKRGDFATVRWVYLVLAAVSAAIGVLTFNWGLSKIPADQEVSSYLVLVIVVQVMVAGLFQVAVGGMTGDKLFGFFLAVLAAYYLVK